MLQNPLSVAILTSIFAFSGCSPTEPVKPVEPGNLKIHVRSEVGLPASFADVGLIVRNVPDDEGSIEQIPEGNLLFVKRANPKGFVDFHEVESGELGILVRCIGFEDFEGSVNVHPSTTTVDSITLHYISEAWTVADQTPESMFATVIGVIDGQFYIVNRIYPFGPLHVFDPITGSWSTAAGLPTPRHNSVAGVISGRIYVVGGDVSYPAHEILDVVESYNPITDSWNARSPMPEPRAGAVSSVIDGKMYVAGGYDTTACADLFMYDPVTDSWSELSPMTFARDSAASAVVNGELLVAGGAAHIREGSGWHHVPIDVLEIYDPTVDRWVTASPMLRPEIYSFGAALDDRFLITGGISGEGSRVLMIYDPGPNSWSMGQSMLEGFSLPSGGVCLEKLFIFPGFNPFAGGYRNIQVYSP